LENHHFNDHDLIDEFLGTSANIFISQEDLLIGTSSSAYYRLCHVACNIISCDENIPCSLNIQSNELNFELIQGSEVIHDEEQNNEIIDHPFLSLQPPVLHKDDSLVQVTHETSLIYTSSDIQLKEL